MSNEEKIQPEMQPNEEFHAEIAAKILDRIGITRINVHEFTERPDVKDFTDAVVALCQSILDIAKKDAELNKISIKEAYTNRIEEICSKSAKHELSGAGKNALTSVIPNNYLITNNKLSNEMTKDFVNKGEIELIVSGKGRKNEVITYNTLSYDSKWIEIYGSEPFTAYDRAVHNAVCSLYAVGNNVITPAMVYRTMTGMTDGEYTSPQAIETITASIDKSRFTRLKVDFSAEAKSRNIDIDKTVIDSYLLAADAITITAGGHEVTGFKLLREPILYAYARRTKQIISVPLSLLDTREATRNTEDIIVIKEYLIRRIEIMKRNKGVSNKIVYETILSEANISQTTKEKTFKLRENIKSILVLWQRKKYIKDFSEYKEGRRFKGIEITY